jgi:plastocyanin
VLRHFIMFSGSLIVLTTCLVICGASIGELGSTASATANQVQARHTTATADRQKLPNPDTNVPTNQVHLEDTDFAQHTVTIKKGELLVLINNSFALHVIANGSWDTAGDMMPNVEVGAPKVNVVVTGGSRQSIGPFTTAGTFHLYCSIHPHMNLTVIVQ